jgi:glycine oxidase
MIEVVVVGGGLAGTAVALALVERGAAVNVLDVERPGSAATGASAGMLAPQYESAGRGPLYSVLVESRERYGEFVRRIERLAGVSVGHRRDGMLVANLTAAEHAAAAAMLAWQHAEGQRGELIDGASATRLQPGIAPDIDSWLWLPDEAQVDAQRLADCLTHALSAAGARVLAGRRAVAVESAAGTVTGVRLEDGRVLAADAVVVAAGAWSSVLEGLPHRLRVRPVRGHILRFAAGAAPLKRIVASHAGRYLVPRSDGTVLAGSTMDESGYDRSIDDARLGIVHDACARLLPALRHRRPAEVWADLRPISADGLPVIGPAPGTDGLFYATGYGRNGILIAPAAGEIVARLVLGDTAPGDWRAFAPDRAAADAPERIRRTTD